MEQGINYEEDSLENQGPTNMQLEELSDLADRQLELEALIEATEKELAEYRKQHKAVTETSIPELMGLIGMQEFVLESGFKLSIKKYYGANINDENRDQCFGWLRDHELADIIKHEITAKLGMDSDEEASFIRAFLKEKRVDFTDKEFVHPMTLKSFIKEQCEENENFPKEMFKVYEGKQSKITAPRRKK